jgi:hypothetical protein
MKFDFLMVKRILTALSYTAIAVTAAMQTNPPQTVEAWIGIGVLAVTTFWAKFSSNTTIVAPNRAVFTPEERAALKG